MRAKTGERIAIGIVLVLILGAILFFGPAGPSTNPGGPARFGPPPLALSAPSENVSGGTFWYNFTVLSSGAGWAASELTFQVETASGAPLVLPSATVALLPPGGTTPVETYYLDNSTWVGPNPNMVTVTGGSTLNLASPSSLSHEDVSLMATVNGPSQQSIDVLIP